MADPLGVSIAFDDATLEPTPTWTRIDTITEANVRSWEIERGRRTEFEKTGTGTAVVRIVDKEGVFDPTNTGSAYYDGLEPMKQAAISLFDPVLEEWHTIFRGFIEDWNYVLHPTRDWFDLELQLVDGFAVLASSELVPGQDGDTLPSTVADGNVFYEDTAGTVDDRILAILADVGWQSGMYEVFSGNVRVREKVYAPGTSALQALMDAADAEFPGVANCYMSKTGLFTFHGRFARFNPQVAQYNINERNVGDPDYWVTDADVVPLSGLGFTKGNANVFNAALAYPEGIDDADISAQWSSDATSIAAYGRRALTFENLQTSYDISNGYSANDATKAFADYYVANYKDPLPRPNQMVFRSRALDNQNAGALWKHMTRVEISDLLNLTTTHPGGGGFAAEGFFVEGIRYEGHPANTEVHDIVLSCDVSPQAQWANSPFSTRAAAVARGQAGTVVIA